MAKSYVYARGPYDTEKEAEDGKIDMAPHWKTEIDVLKLNPDLEIVAADAEGKWYACVQSA